jgi:UDP-N-acetylglucosamine 2-epimerase (non-hydrolysing)
VKIITITGTRPELIRLSIILRKLDEVCDHVHVYTNQNFDPNLSTIFLRELRIREPDYYFKKTNGFAEFISNAIIEFDSILTREKPDKVLFLGDTNSGLLCIIASKRGIPVYHMEAGNRCYDGQVPEETNRRIVDVCSYINLPYTENSKQNLINERFHKNFVFKTGNPIKEVLKYYEDDIEQSGIIEKLGLWTLSPEYALLTFHRTENVDSKERSTNLVDAINEIDLPVVYSFHPRTRDQFAKHGIAFKDHVILTDPIGFFDFVKLEKYAKVVLTDSGTVPEETSIFGVPTIVLRNTTERQELNENGSCILAGLRKDDILRAYESITKLPQVWPALEDYHKENVSDTVVRLLLGQAHHLVRKGHDEY